jgi:hypothetical protein
MVLVWNQIIETVKMASVAQDDGNAIDLIVESLEDSRYEWTVLDRGRASTFRTGISSTAGAAISAAEAAAEEPADPSVKAISEEM